MSNVLEIIFSILPYLNAWFYALISQLYVFIGEVGKCRWFNHILLIFVCHGLGVVKSKGFLTGAEHCIIWKTVWNCSNLLRGLFAAISLKLGKYRLAAGFLTWTILLIKDSAWFLFCGVEEKNSALHLQIPTLSGIDVWPMLLPFGERRPNNAIMDEAWKSILADWNV